MRNLICRYKGHEWGEWMGDFGNYHTLIRFCKRCEGTSHRENPLVNDHAAREATLQRVARSMFEISPQMREVKDVNGNPVEHPDYQKYLAMECCSYMMSQWMMEQDPDAPTWDELSPQKRADYRAMAYEMTNGGLDMVIWGPEKALLA